jgi:hypothetical protein
MALVATLQMVSVCVMPRLCAWRSAAKVSAVSPLWVMVTMSEVGYRFAVAVFAGNLDLARHFGDRFDPVLGHAAAVVAGAAGQDQHTVDGLEGAVRAVAKQLGRDAFHAFERVGNGAGLLEDFFLHVVTVRPQFGRAAVGVHGFHGAGHGLVIAVHHPVFAQLDVDHVALFQVHDLVGHAGQCHRVAGQKGFALAHTQNQRRARTRTDHALRLVFVEHGNRVRAMQLADGGFDGFKQVALVHAVDQVRDDLGVGLAQKHIALGLQSGAQCFVVFDDAVVHQSHLAGLGVCCARAVAEVRVRVVHRGCAVRGPTRVGNAGAAFDVVGRDLVHQLGHTRGAAGALQATLATQTGRVHGHAARVIAPVFQPLQALHEDGNDVAGRNGADDATHVEAPWWGVFIKLERC